MYSIKYNMNRKCFNDSCIPNEYIKYVKDSLQNIIFFYFFNYLKITITSILDPNRKEEIVQSTTRS